MFVLFPAIIDRNAEQREGGGAQPEAQEQEPDEEQTPKAPKDLYCSICLSIFQTPVILQCGHSFCRTCVEKSWEGKGSRRCSLCDQLFTGAEPQVNFSLKNLSENYRESRSQPRPAHQVFPTHPRAHARRCCTLPYKICLIVSLLDASATSS